MKTFGALENTPSKAIVVNGVASRTGVVAVVYAGSVASPTSNVVKLSSCADTLFTKASVTKIVKPKINLLKYKLIKHTILDKFKATL